jgi:hypothetical protein
MGVTKGKTVLYNKFGIGCTDIEMGGDSYIMIKEGDLIGTFPNSGATADDIPNMTPMVRREDVLSCPRPRFDYLIMQKLDRRVLFFLSPPHTDA